MIELPPEDIHRLRQLRDDLEWFTNKVDEQVYQNQPWRHYLITMRTAQGVVGSVLRNSTVKEPA